MYIHERIIGFQLGGMPLCLPPFLKRWDASRDCCIALCSVVVAKFAATTSPASSSFMALAICLRFVFELRPNSSAIFFRLRCFTVLPFCWLPADIRSVTLMSVEYNISRGRMTMVSTKWLFTGWQCMSSFVRRHCMSRWPAECQLLSFLVPPFLVFSVSFPLFFLVSLLPFLDYYVYFCS